MSWPYLALAVGLALLAAVLASRSGRRLLATFAVGVKYALLWAIDRLQLRRLWTRPYAPLTHPHLLRRAFEDLGASYIKLGQIVASSPGLFTRPYVDEFRSCLDRAPEFDGERARAIVRAELGARMDTLTFDPQPLASASIAQVHAARAADGTELVIKIRRPKIAHRVEADVKIMRFWARLAHALLPSARLANPIGVVDDFGETIRRELDFVGEADNIDDFNRIMAELGHTRVCAPRVYRELSTSRVLTMERFFGHTIDDVEAIKASAHDAEQMLIDGMRAWFQSVMLRGLFHGDVHAGNLMWLDDGRIGFLDFGIVGRFDDRQRRLATRYIMAMATGQYEQLARVVLEMGGVQANVDLKLLAADMKRAYGPMRQKSMGDLDYNELLPAVLGMARKHRLTMPREFILILKQVLYFDRYAKLLAPELNLFSDPRLFASLAADVQKVLMGA